MHTRSFMGLGLENRRGASGSGSVGASGPPACCNSMNNSTQARWIVGSTRSRVVHDRILFPVYFCS